jgi:hypothetical protein
MHTIDNVRLQNNKEKYQRNIWDLHTEQTKFFLENAKQRLPEVQTLVRDLHIALPTGWNRMRRDISQLKISTRN